MPSPFAIVKQALEESRPDNRKSWRDDLRKRLPMSQLHDILADFAEGKPRVVMLADGRMSAPIQPSPDTQFRAAMFLHEALYGKAVAQTEIQKAEHEAKEFEAIRALNDDELELEAGKILEARRVAKLSAGQITEAEYVELPKPRHEDDLLARIWASPMPGE